MSNQDSFQNENELHRVMAGLREADPAYAALLSDLAVMKLNQGRVEEAQRMFHRLVVLRSQQVDVSAHSEGVQNPDKEIVTTAASPIPTNQNPIKSLTENRASPPPTPGPSLLTIPKTQASSCTEPTMNNNNNTSGSSLRAQQPPSARPRGGAAMVGGAAMFARALGNRTASSSRPRRNSGLEPISVPASSEAAAAAPTLIGAVARPLTHGSQPMGCTAAGASSQTGAYTAGGELLEYSQAETLSPDNAGETVSAGLLSVGLNVGGPPSTKVASWAPAPAWAYSDGSGSDERQHHALCKIGDMQCPEGLAAAAFAAADRTSAQDTDEDGRVAPHTGNPSSSSGGAATTRRKSASGGGGDVTESYLSTAAAAVAAMTTRPSATGWDSSCGGAAGGGSRQDSRPASRVEVGTGGGGGGSGRAAAVKEYYLEPRAPGSESDPSAAEADAALRASLGECRHVLEVYGLTTAVRTTHLQEFVSEVASQDGRPLPVIKWVDDNHALLVCPDGATAMYLLQVDQDLFRLRPFSEASLASQAVAAEDLLPPRERPKTTAAVAKRLLSHALGMSQLRDREAEKDLAEQRKAAREARQERERKLAAAWDDD